MDLNKIYLVGRLTRDPEQKSITVQGTRKLVVEFSLAVNTNGTEEADVISCVAYSGHARRFCASKGQSVFIQGRLRHERWISSDGSPRARHG